MFLLTYYIIRFVILQVTNKIEFSKTVQVMDEAISLNPSFIKKTSSEDDGLSLGQGSSKSYQT